jgi:hypothetical protein
MKLIAEKVVKVNLIRYNFILQIIFFLKKVLRLRYQMQISLIDK